MAATHDYQTKIIPPSYLNSTHVLVGESGGLSAVYEDAEPSSILPGLLVIVTEHGPLYLDPDESATILNEG